MPFKGSINRVIVVAGPSGCGKSTFLDNPMKYIDPANIPDELYDMEVNAAKHIDLGDLRDYSHPNIDDLWVHVDTLQHFHNLPTVNTDTLYEIINERFFESWGSLKFLSIANEIHFLTLYTDRDIAFRRYIDREIEKKILKVKNNMIERRKFRLFFRHPIKQINNKGGILSNITNIYGADSRSDTLYKAIYNSWFNYISSKAGKSYWVMNASETPYKITAGNSLPKSDKL